MRWTRVLAAAEPPSCYPWNVIHGTKTRGFAALALLLAIGVAGCRKEEQAVVNVAQTAVNAEHKAQEAATERDRQRATLAAIPLPTKSLYLDVHE
ncbi:MAG TPA: hypothetical protein VFC15_06390, partial [Candidatus Limnocylindrales bacterium]|nr:hypothetical protein [Candidatus Limnocylindrales bacterium]